MFRLILHDRSQISPATLYVQRLSFLSNPKGNEKRNVYFIERSGKIAASSKRAAAPAAAAIATDSVGLRRRAEDVELRQRHVLVALPAAAQRFIERHQIERALHARLGRLLLRLRQLTLCVQHIDKG